MTGTHRCATKSCPFAAPADEDLCDFCRDMNRLMDKTNSALASSRLPEVIALPHTE